MVKKSFSFRKPCHSAVQILMFLKSADVLDIFSFPKELVIKHLKQSMKQKIESTYDCSVEGFHANLGRLVILFENLKI